MPRNLIGRTVQDIPSEGPAEQQQAEAEEARPRFNGMRDLLRLATSRRQNRPSNSGNEEDAAMPATPAASSRECKAKASSKKYHLESQLDSLVFGHDIDGSGVSEDILAQEEAQARRRLKKPVMSADGKVIDAQRPSANRGRPSGIRHLDHMPAPQKHPNDGSKRQYAWIHKPTAWDNPVTYEEPPEPGKRPSHPVCVVGPVCTERKRAFPEKAAAVGRACWQQQQAVTEVEPPNRELEEGEEAEFRVSDAHVKTIPKLKCNENAWLTQWHWDSRHDIDPPKRNKYMFGMPDEACTSTCDRSVYRVAAGKASLVRAEGCGLSFYDKVRMMDEARGMTPAPLTAR